MKEMILTGVVVRDSGAQLDIIGRARLVPIALVTGALAAVATRMTAAAGYWRFILALGVTVGIGQTVVRARTRLVLQPNGFVLAGWDGFRRYDLTGTLTELDVIGVVAMLPHLEGMPYKDPGFFLQLAVAGRTYRAFPGLDRADLEDVLAQLVRWKVRFAV